MKTVYDYSDKIIEMMDDIIIREFNKARNKVINGFDELHYFKECDILYKKLDRAVRKHLIALANKVYEEYDGDVDLIEEISEYIDVMLSTPNSVTTYAYDKELVRKQDRLSEALYITDKGGVAKEFDKAMKLFSKMATQYADEVALGIYILTLKQKGVKMVRWMTEHDERVCEFCLPLDNKVFPIDKIPDRQHWGCRCWIEPV